MPSSKRKKNIQIENVNKEIFYVSICQPSAGNYCLRQIRRTKKIKAIRKLLSNGFNLYIFVARKDHQRKSKNEIVSGNFAIPHKLHIDRVKKITSDN